MTAVRVPATSANLGPGFDAFGLALDLHLTARVAERADRHVVTTGEGDNELPGDDGNLVWRSFVAGCERFGVEVPDVTLLVDNHIPLERGLGSSSAAIVAGVGLARALSEATISDQDLATLADELEGHPDNVVPAVLGGLTVSARDDDGALVVRRANPHPALTPIAFVPDARQSTVTARDVVPEVLSAVDAAQQAARAGHVIGALLGVWPADARLAGDRLHEPPRLEVMGAGGALLSDLRSHGFHAWLSGAGPTVVAAVHRGEVGSCMRLADGHDFRPVRLGWDLGGLVSER
ncbi:MAG: homoserine kinase [Nitriliruptorales bacterium]|nr:homoserine kinase [Nitriliruptorales bacterium]